MWAVRVPSVSKGASLSEPSVVSYVVPVIRGGGSGRPSPRYARPAATAKSAASTAHVSPAWRFGATPGGRGANRAFRAKAQLRRRLESARRLLLDTPAYEAIQRRWRVWWQLGRLVVEDRIHHLTRGAGAEGTSAAGHFVQNNTAAEDVRACIGGSPRTCSGDR